MKQIIITAAAAILLMPASAVAQERKPISFELEEEKLSIEADLPSVDIFLSFAEMQERNKTMKESFIDEIIESARQDPF